MGDRLRVAKQGQCCGRKMTDRLRVAKQGQCCDITMTDRLRVAKQGQCCGKKKRLQFWPFQKIFICKICLRKKLVLLKLSCHIITLFR